MMRAVRRLYVRIDPYTERAVEELSSLTGSDISTLLRVLLHYAVELITDEEGNINDEAKKRIGEFKDDEDDRRQLR